MLYELRVILLESSQQILDEFATALLDVLQLFETVNAYVVFQAHC